jgi:hypothetical protein
MGEGTSSVDPEEHLDEVSERIEKSRARLDRLVSELDQRRHVVINFKRRVSEHPLWALAAGVLTVGLVGGVVVLAVHQQRQRQALVSRASRLRRAVARMIDKPDRVAPAGASLTGKALTAAASAASTILVKRLLASLGQPPLAAQPQAPGGDRST